jgi:predicted aldo/keto reductase-like oxidoreductase
LCDELITTAIKAGINYFDTAHMYSGSEATLGGILKKHGLREKVFIADKLPHFRCKSSSDIEKYFSESLERLQTDYIDYYLIHNIGSLDAWNRLESFGIREWIAKKKEAGLIREIGFSFHGKSVDFLPLLDAYEWDFCQIQYNYLNENYQAGTAGLKAIHERGLAAIIMEPLLGGKLAQNLPQEAKNLFDQTTPGRTPAAWGFKWLFDKPEVTVVLSGMNTMEQLSENIEIAKNTPAGSLTDAERAVYEEACNAISHAYKVPCTGCDYCMPCPSGVNIPACFNAYNMSYVIGYSSGMMLYMTSTMGFGTSRSSPGNCTKCGICTKKCPQGIDIQNRLNDVHKRLEPLPIRLVLKVVKRVMG